MVKSGDAVVSAVKVHQTAAMAAAAAAAREALWCLHVTISPTSTLSCDRRESSKSVTQVRVICDEAHMHESTDTG